jgi:hypothetical protein
VVVKQGHPLSTQVGSQAAALLVAATPSAGVR